MEFRDLKTQYLNHKENIDKAIEKVLLSSQFIGGNPVKELEKNLADYVGRKYCITCANGTDALELVLLAWGIKEGDAVFVPDFTFFSTAEVVSRVGATPVFVDVNTNTFNIDVSSLEQAIEKVIEDGKLSAKAIIPVDLFGLPADYPKISPIAKKYNLKVLEDGAQGFGGHIEIDGKINRACSFGDASTTSFFPAKPLGCYGDGGAIFVDDENLKNLLESLKVHGKGNHKYNNVRVGMNSRLDTVQAAILNEKFKFFVSDELDLVNEVYDYYSKNLKEVIDENNINIKLPKIPKNFYSSFAQYTVIAENEEQRDKLREDLSKKEIPTNIYYPRGLSQQKAFEKNKLTPVSLKNSENLCKSVFSLPMHPYMSKEDIDIIINSFK